MGNRVAVLAPSTTTNVGGISGNGTIKTTNFRGIPISHHNANQFQNKNCRATIFVLITGNKILKQDWNNTLPFFFFTPRPNPICREVWTVDTPASFDDLTSKLRNEWQHGWTLKWYINAEDEADKNELCFFTSLGGQNLGTHFKHVNVIATETTTLLGEKTYTFTEEPILPILTHACPIMFS